jgi:hypothetical protein
MYSPLRNVRAVSAHYLHHRCPRPGDKWPVDAVFCTITGAALVPVYPRWTVLDSTVVASTLVFTHLLSSTLSIYAA